MARSRARIKSFPRALDARVGGFANEFAKTFGTDVMRNARRSLKRAPRKKSTTSTGSGGMTDEELKAYREYVARRRYWIRRKRLGRLPKRYNGDIPKKYRQPPSKAYRMAKINGRLRAVPLVPRMTAPPGRPPYLHDSQRRLSRLIQFDVDKTRSRGTIYVRRVIIGPAITRTKSEPRTPRILEYGRGGSGVGNPFMRPAFEKSLKKVNQIGRYAARKARSRR